MIANAKLISWLNVLLIHMTDSSWLCFPLLVDIAGFGLVDCSGCTWQRKLPLCGFVLDMYAYTEERNVTGIQLGLDWIKFLEGEYSQVQYYRCTFYLLHIHVSNINLHVLAGKSFPIIPIIYAAICVWRGGQNRTVSTFFFFFLKKDST